MTIIEAIRSGKRVTRPGITMAREIYEKTQGWIAPNHDVYQFLKEDLLADDWEIEEEKIEITRSKLTSAFEQCQGSTFFGPGQFEETIAKLLGFK